MPDGHTFIGTKTALLEVDREGNETFRHELTEGGTFMRANLYWMKAQEFAETFCVPSEALEYRDSLAKPSGIQVVP